MVIFISSMYVKSCVVPTFRINVFSSVRAVVMDRDDASDAFECAFRIMMCVYMCSVSVRNSFSAIMSSFVKRGLGGGNNIYSLDQSVQIYTHKPIVAFIVHVKESLSFYFNRKYMSSAS